MTLMDRVQLPFMCSGMYIYIISSVPARLFVFYTHVSYTITYFHGGKELCSAACISTRTCAVRDSYDTIR